MADLSVTDRLDALARAVRAGRAVLAPELVAAAQQVEDRAGHRLRLSADHTVVALAGSTGSGKSSLLNALVGEAVAAVDVLRPTTSEALAVVRGPDGAAPLLDWLGIRRRHTVVDVVGTVGSEDEADGLVLIDLPDHDSVRTEHRLEAERLLALVDLMVWVVDPQKYADAAVHERYLRGLSAHAHVVLVVLNQVDRLTTQDRAACHADLQRLLAEDGLAGVRVLDVSARTGEGVDGLRAALDDAARQRVAARARVEADVAGVAQQILDRCGSAEADPHASRAELVEALCVAAGVPVVADALRRAHVLHARRATGWPPTRGLSRLRVDPLRRLHLSAGGRPGGARDRSPDGPGDADAMETLRTSIPAPGPAELARARAAVRAYTDAATAVIPDSWVLAARARTDGAATDHDLPDALDRAVAGTRVGAARRPAWWSIVCFLQWLLLTVLVVGLVWLGALAVLGALALPVPDPPRWGEVPVPTVALIGAAVAGLLLAGLARLLAGVGARRAAARATRDLQASVAQVADRLVVEPVDEVLAARRACRASALLAAGPPRADRSRRTAWSAGRR